MCVVHSFEVRLRRDVWLDHLKKPLLAAVGHEIDAATTGALREACRGGRDGGVSATRMPQLPVAGELLPALLLRHRSLLFGGAPRADGGAGPRSNVQLAQEASHVLRI
jgi:hypothetical protein